MDNNEIINWIKENCKYNGNITFRGDSSSREIYAVNCLDGLYEIMLFKDLHSNKYSNCIKCRRLSGLCFVPISWDVYTLQEFKENMLYKFQKNIKEFE